LSRDPLVPGQGHRGDPAAPYVKKLSPGLSGLAHNKLIIVNAAESINDLRVPPVNQLEKLVDSRAGQYSVRINDQWRICFTWSTAGAGNVDWSTTTRAEKLMADFAPTHPGEILLTEFLEPMGISQYRIAKVIDVPPRRINEIVHGKRGITADTALRLSRALGLSDMFFINMQAHYDAEIALEHIGSELATIERIS
jgi:antitoxin HigA-1